MMKTNDAIIKMMGIKVKNIRNTMLKGALHYLLLSLIFIVISSFGATAIFALPIAIFSGFFMSVFAKAHGEYRTLEQIGRKDPSVYPEFFLKPQRHAVIWKIPFMIPSFVKKDYRECVELVRGFPDLFYERAI